MNQAGWMPGAPPAGPVPAPSLSPRGGQAGGADDDTPPADAGLAAPVPVPLLGAWQAALLARVSGPSPAAAGAVADPSATQSGLASAAQAAQAGGRDAEAVRMPVQAGADARHIEAEIHTGAGPAWQLSLQRAPDAAAWSLHLATPAAAAAWATTQLPKLERRLRLQGHAVEQMGWRPQPEPEHEEPR